MGQRRRRVTCSMCGVRRHNRRTCKRRALHRPAAVPIDDMAPMDLVVVKSPNAANNVEMEIFASGLFCVIGLVPCDMIDFECSE